MSNPDSRKKAALLRQQLIRSKAQAQNLNTVPPRFVADVMVGRLARWLRIAGFDVLYSNRYTDDELVALAKTEKRILLSRDTRLLLRKSVRRFIYLESENVVTQLKEVFEATETEELPGLLTRCLSCNDPLEDLPREEVRGSVPPYVFRTQARFKTCRRCHRIFWAGTHRQAVMHTFENLLKGPRRSGS